MKKTNTDKENAPLAVAKLAYTRDEAAAQLGVHAITIDRLTKRGELRPSRGCRRPLYPHEELLRFLRDTASKPIKTAV